jgi:hypothetical protein
LTHDQHTTDADHDAHAHDEPALGPIDWGAWTYATLGVAAGVVIVALFWFASGGVH